MCLKYSVQELLSVICGKSKIKYVYLVQIQKFQFTPKASKRPISKWTVEKTVIYYKMNQDY